MIQATKISPFDVTAETYDEDFIQSGIGRLQRNIVWEIITGVLRSYSRPLHILEINCGTGEDALQLARLGHKVVATDASAQMIGKAKQKANTKESINNQVEFLALSFDQLEMLKTEQPFDLVISNFGGLNCIDEVALAKLANVLSGMMSPGGKLVLVVLSKCCLWEIGYYTLKGKFSKALRRFRKSTPFRIEDHLMEIYYYSPSKLLAVFKPSFGKLLSKPVGLFVPPSYLEFIFLKRPQLLQTLNNWEKKFGVPSLSFLADHYCVVLNKQNTK